MKSEITDKLRVMVYIKAHEDLWYRLKVLKFPYLITPRLGIFNIVYGIGG